MHYSAQSLQHDLVSEQKSVLDRASMDAVRDVTLSRRTIEHIHSLLRELAMATMDPPIQDSVIMVDLVCDELG